MKRLAILFLFFVTLVSHPLFAVKNLLILGDSHFVGHFGEYVHKNLHETNKYDILSISISGAGTKHFTLTLKNFCCGYKIRYSCAGINELNEKNEISIIEKSSSGNNCLVGKSWKGKLPNLLTDWIPDAVIFSLGSNNVNAHQELVDIIRSYNVSIPIIWVGPFRRKGNADRYKQIEKTVNANTDIHLVRSDDILGNDTITMAHFYGKAARNWANKVTERMKPILMKIFLE